MHRAWIWRPLAAFTASSKLPLPNAPCAFDHSEVASSKSDFAAFKSIPCGKFPAGLFAQQLDAVVNRGHELPAPQPITKSTDR